MRSWIGPLLLVFAAVAVSCGKVPIYHVNASFKQADAAWFEEEETLFLFYEVRAEQGLGDPSLIEIRYTTDDERVPWTPIEDFPTVHRHVPVDCGEKRRCGSTSIHVPKEPRNVGIRLRYHRDTRCEDFADGSTAGECEVIQCGDEHAEAAVLCPDTRFNVVAAGPAHTNRSAVVYGVFDESNTLVQWRSRNVFPTVRNERATELGLRRDLTIRQQRFGRAEARTTGNPYLYGVNCPDNFVALPFLDLSTDERAIFNEEPLPLGASDASLVCAESIVTDAVGDFPAVAAARKNPEVRSAFPALTSPVLDATQIPFFLAPCNENISPVHARLQRQRLFLDGLPKTCIDDWDQPGFVDSLVVTFRDAIEAARPAGDDMVLVIALHQDDQGASRALEEALARVVPPERHRTSPRLAGAFVFDSTDYGLRKPEIETSVLWCPSTISLDEIPNASARSCPIMPDIPDLDLGPFSFGFLPVLPTREQYLDFLVDYTERQAGEVTSLRFLAPEFATTADHTDVGEFGVVTFLNGEAIDASPTDAFSYCAQEESPIFMVRSPLMTDPYILYQLQYACSYYYYDIPQEVCDAAAIGMIPIEALPEWHNLLGERSYEIGLFWEFPFLLRMEYEATLAASVSAFGLSVPFGVSSPEQAYYGAQLWEQDEFPIEPLITQCRRYCDHPTFDSAGVYHPTDPFREAYAYNCYLPRFPLPGDSGFPLDP